jgi:hypothetical protein
VLGLSVVPDAEQGSPLAKGAAAYRSQGIAVKMRTKAETERFFDGLDLIDPGVTPVTPVTHWHPDRPVDPDDPVHHRVCPIFGVTRSWLFTSCLR